MKKTLKFSKQQQQQQQLNTSIDALRDVLNEMCCTIDEREVNLEKLTISQQLDKMIVKYMKMKKNSMNS